MTNDILNKDNNRIILHVVADDSSIMTSLGISPDRGQELVSLVNQVLHYNMLDPDAQGRFETKAELLHHLSKSATNMQELCVIMYLAGYQERVNEELIIRNHLRQNG